MNVLKWMIYGEYSTISMCPSMKHRRYSHVAAQCCLIVGVSSWLLTLNSIVFELVVVAADDNQSVDDSPNEIGEFQLIYPMKSVVIIKS